MHADRNKTSQTSCSSTEEMMVQGYAPRKAERVGHVRDLLKAVILASASGKSRLILETEAAA